MTTTNQKTMDCPRCCGKGEISAFRHVIGGTCFKCGGSGKVAYRAPAKANKFSQINAMHCKTVEEANEYRLQIFAERFPELVVALDAQPEIKFNLVNGGSIKHVVARLQK